MKLSKTLTKLIIYLFFPLMIIFFGFRRDYLYLSIVIILYFTVFFFLKKEELFIILAGYHDKNKHSLKSLKYLLKAYQLKSSSMDTANKFIYLLLKNEKYKKCGQIISEVEKREMTDTEKEILLSNKALYLWKSKQIKQAITLYDQLIETHESTSIYTAYGYVVTLGNDLDKALNVNLQAHNFNSNSKGIMDNLGLTYIKMGKLDKAEKIYKKLIEKNPTFPEAYYNMGILMQLRGNLAESKYYIKRALEKPFNGLSTISKDEVNKKLNYINRLQGNIS
ncbi:MAG: tetratricopeptide repeat protein [Clostridiales bacterium]|nr:tetratricopeptide repeat protein [Clostridiales bacterium]